jgi:hypothetical protein
MLHCCIIQLDAQDVEEGYCDSISKAEVLVVLLHVEDAAKTEGYNR